jgi:hypothetical protein
MATEEAGDSSDGSYEVLGERSMRSVPDDDEERNAISNDGGELIGLVPDSCVACHGHPAALSNDPQPFFVRAISWEVLGVALHLDPIGRKERRKRVPEVAICEEDEVQAARSYRTASSISAWVRP